MRAQATAVFLLSIGMVATPGIVALHEWPFGGPFAVSPEPLRLALGATVSAGR